MCSTFSYAPPCMMWTVSPEVDKSPVYRKAAAASGSTATMTCTADGAPGVDFAWFKVAALCLLTAVVLYAVSWVCYVLTDVDDWLCLVWSFTVAAPSNPQNDRVHTPVGIVWLIQQDNALAHRDRDMVELLAHTRHHSSYLPSCLVLKRWTVFQL